MKTSPKYNHNVIRVLSSQNGNNKTGGCDAVKFSTIFYWFKSCSFVPTLYTNAIRNYIYVITNNEALAVTNWITFINLKNKYALST